MSTRLLSITWLRDSPFDLYVTNDYIEVWWNGDLNEFEVYLNASQVFTGTDIPVQSWTYAGIPSSEYKEEVIYSSSICDETSLLSFQRISFFPYLSYSEQLNHPSCIINPGPGDDPLVCDIGFNSLPIVTNASSDISLDGQIIVSASSSHGNIKYKLNQDFEYSELAQTSGTFTGLGIGTYQIFARDEINCLAVINVNVGVDISSLYETHYQLEFYNIETVPSRIKVEILEKAYVGDIVDMICAEGNSPVIFRSRGEGETDKFVSVLATELIFNLISETEGQYISLYTNDSEKYRLRLSIDEGSGYSVKWIGNVLTNQYRENYVSPPYGITVIASDSLPILSKIPFSDDDGSQLRGQFKQIEIIAFILKKTGLNLSIRVGCNIYATDMNSDASDDPLDQAYVDVLRYYLINNNPNCLEVLKYILEPYGAQIMAYDNYWNIIRVEEKVADFDYRIFDYNGQYLSNGTYSPLKEVRNSSNVSSFHWKDQDAVMEIQPGFGTMQLIYDLGKKPNLLVNGDFSVRKYSYYGYGFIGEDVLGGVQVGSGSFSGEIADMTGFQLVNNGAVITRSFETIDNENISLGFTTNQTGAFLATDPFILKLGNADTLRVTYTFKIKNIYQAPLNQNNYIKVKLLVNYGDYYLLNNGQWTNVVSSITYYVQPSDFDQYIDYTVLSAPPQEDYYLGQPIHVKMYIPVLSDPDFTLIDNLKALPTTNLQEGYRTELLSNDFLKLYQLTRTTDTADDLNIIEPDDYNSVTNPYQWTLQYSTYSTTTGGTASIFIDKIKLDILNNGRELASNTAFNEVLETKNKLILNKVIYHGSVVYNGKTILNFGLASLPVNIFIGQTASPVSFFYSQNFYSTISFNANSGDTAYCGYLRDANGDGYTNWIRDGANESKAIEEIFIDMYRGQYNKPWRKIIGSLISRNGIMSPIDSIKDYTESSERIYYSPAISIDYKMNSYTGEFLELSDFTDTNSDDSPAAFTTGFSLGFKS